MAKANWERAAVGIGVLAIVFIAAVLSWAWYGHNGNGAYLTPSPEASQPQEVEVLYIRSPQFYEERIALFAGADVSEAYLMEKIHSEWAKNIVVLFDRVYNQCGVKSVSTHSWPDDGTVTVYLGWGEDGTGIDNSAPYKVKFSKVHYDPELSKFNYGKTSISQQLPTELSGHAYLFDLTKDEAGGTFEQTDSVTLEQHRETTITKSVEMNYSLQSETTFGGSYAGVSLEEKLTVAFGQAFKDEESTAEGESKSVTEEHKFDVDLEPLKATLVLLESVEVHSSTPFTIDGVADWQVDIFVPHSCAPPDVTTQDGSAYTKEFLDWYGKGAWWFTDADNLDWCYRNTPIAGSPFFDQPCQLTYGKDGAAIEELRQMFNGTNPRWPGLAKHGFENGGWVEHRSVCDETCFAAWHDFQNPDLRHIELTGVQHRVYENTIKETISDVTGQDLDAVAREHAAERPQYNPKGE